MMEEALHRCRTCTHSAQDHPRRPARPCVAPGYTCGGYRTADPIVCLDCGHTANLHSQTRPAPQGSRCHATGCYCPERSSTAGRRAVRLQATLTIWL